MEKLFLSRGRPCIHVRQRRTLDKRASPRQKIDVSAYRTEPAGRHTCLFMLGFHENRAQCGKAYGLAPCRHPVGSLVLRPYDVRLCSIVAERLAGPWPSKQRSRLQPGALQARRPPAAAALRAAARCGSGGAQARADAVVRRRRPGGLRCGAGGRVCRRRAGMRDGLQWLLPQAAAYWQRVRAVDAVLPGL